MRLVFWLCLALFAGIVTYSSAQQAPGRIALVIGNAAYPSTSPPLSTTIADARAITQELRRTGFDVDLKTDLGRADMRSAIDAFASRIGTGTDVLFYFGGYGVEVSGRNYLIPINGDPWTERDVVRDSISVDDLLAEMQRKGARVKILILDAARSNPYERRFRPSAKGLAAVDLPANTLALFSALPGQLVEDRAGANSVFAKELIKEIITSSTAEHAFNNVQAALSRRPEVAAGKPGTSAGAGAREVALVESSNSPAVELMDYLQAGQIIRLNAHETIVISYMRSCVRETITGGTVSIGTDSSEVHSGKVTRVRVACDRDGAAASSPDVVASRNATPTSPGPPDPRQVPWVASSLVEQFSFRGEDDRGGAVTRAPAPTAPPQREARIPEFPWPPPAASASYVLPRGLFETPSTIGQVATLIISALERRGYVERSFFRTKPGGVALVTRLERMSDDGSPAAENERWPETLQGHAGLAGFLRGIFYVDPGRYRVIVFIFQDQPFAQSRQEVTGDVARSWLSEGLNVLPTEQAQRSFADGDCTALVYEFASTGKVVSRVTSRLTGKQHLEKAGVLTLLAQSR
jgi:hypothetical protein